MKEAARRRLLRRLATIEAERTTLLGHLAELPPEVLERKPAPEAWSILQVLSHLALADELSLAYIRKKMWAGEELAASGLGGLGRYALLAAAMRSPLRFRAPARTAELPEEASLPDLERRWDAVRDSWRGLVEEFPATLFGRAVYRHPRAGMLDLAQAVGFMRDHQRRHARQIARLEAG